VGYHQGRSEYARKLCNRAKKKFGPTGLFVWAFDLLNVIAIYLKVEISMAPENLLSFFLIIKVYSCECVAL